MQHREITSSRLSWARLQERQPEQLQEHQLSALQPEQVPGPEQVPERVPGPEQVPGRVQERVQERVFRRRRSEQVRERKRGGASVS